MDRDTDVVADADVVDCCRRRALAHAAVAGGEAAAGGGEDDGISGEMERMVAELVGGDLQMMNELSLDEQIGDNVSRRAVEGGKRVSKSWRSALPPRSSKWLVKAPRGEMDWMGECTAGKGRGVGVGQRGVEGPTAADDQRGGQQSSQHSTLLQKGPTEEGGRRAEKGRPASGGLAEDEEAIPAVPGAPSLGGDDDSSFSQRALIRVAPVPPRCNGGRRPAATSAAAPAAAAVCGDAGGVRVHAPAADVLSPQEEETAGGKRRGKRGCRSEASRDSRRQHISKQSKTKPKARRAPDDDKQQGRGQRPWPEKKKAAWIKKIKEEARKKKRRKRPERRAAKSIAEYFDLLPFARST